jgi:hypothetical protein
MTVVGWLILMSTGRADWIDQAPPAFRPLPPIRIEQNSGETRLLDLWGYAIDADTPNDSLLFSVAGLRKYPAVILQDFARVLLREVCEQLRDVGRQLGMKIVVALPNIARRRPKPPHWRA